MFEPFERIHSRSRIWIYQSPRKLSAEEINIISEGLQAFTDRWLVHANPMQASFDIRFQQFIILAADEGVNAASGCSIDDSVRTIKMLGSKLGVDFFDRTQVAFLKDGDVLTIPTDRIKEELMAGIWNGDTLVFNNLVGTKGDLDTSWLIPAGTSWLKRYLPKQTVAG
jgi:hypothetical protein